MSDLSLALRQFKFENRSFWRNPAAAFFTFLFPLMFLFIFNLAFGNEEVEISGGTTNVSTVFIIPAITAFSIISACYTNIAMTVALSRDAGILKRMRGTPLPPWGFLFGRISQAVFVALILVLIVILAGVLFYDVDVPSSTLPAFLVTLIVGAATFCSLGIAITCVIPNADAAPAIVNFSILPLLFISDVFLNIETSWVVTLSNVFPIRHFVEALQVAYNPFATGSGFRWGDLAIMLAWAAGGILVSLRFFSWDPRR